MYLQAPTWSRCTSKLQLGADVPPSSSLEQIENGEKYRKQQLPTTYKTFQKQKRLANTLLF
jgi:hypothetical protein